MGIKTYKFNEPKDMIALAQYVQTNVYWGHYFREEDYEGDMIKYEEFWDILGLKIDDYYTSVTIDNSKGIDDIVTYNK